MVRRGGQIGARLERARQGVGSQPTSDEQNFKFNFEFFICLSETVYKPPFLISINPTTKPLLQLFISPAQNSNRSLCEWTSWTLLKKKTFPVELELLVVVVIVSRM